MMSFGLTRLDPRWLLATLAQRSGSLFELLVWLYNRRTKYRLPDGRHPYDREIG